MIYVDENPEHRPVLTTALRPVFFPLDEPTKKLIHEMKETLLEIGGVGLAAPQIGADLQIIAIHISKEAASLREHAQPIPMTVLINPRYQQMENSVLFEDWEGCFSVSDMMGKVPRYFNVRYQAQDETGASIDTLAEGFFARVLQHEIDHVHGILIRDRLDDTCVKGSKEEMMPLRRASLSQEKRALFDQFWTQWNPSKK